MRLFYAINFEKPVKDRIADVQNDLRKQSIGGNFTLQKNLHLTLVFIGEVQEHRARQLFEIAGRLCFEPFALRFDRLGRFKRKDDDLVWMGAEKNEALLSVYGTLASQLRAAGYSIDTRPYTPHLTLARRVKLREGFSLTGYCFDPIVTCVTAASLMKSERINGKLVYTPL